MSHVYHSEQGNEVRSYGYLYVQAFVYLLWLFSLNESLDSCFTNFLFHFDTSEVAFFGAYQKWLMTEIGLTMC